MIESPKVEHSESPSGWVVATSVRRARGPWIARFNHPNRLGIFLRDFYILRVKWLNSSPLSIVEETKRKKREKKNSTVDRSKCGSTVAVAVTDWLDLPSPIDWIYHLRRHLHSVIYSSTSDLLVDVFAARRRRLLYCSSTSKVCTAGSPFLLSLSLSLSLSFVLKHDKAFI